MEKLKMILLLGLALCLGCKRDVVKDFMPGMYVNSAAGEFSVASDTLVIELVEGKNYVIHRRTGFNRIENGKLGVTAYEIQEWKAVYSADSQILTELRKGKIISFFPEGKSLMVGRRVYKKIN